MPVPSGNQCDSEGASEELGLVTLEGRDQPRSIPWVSGCSPYFLVQVHLVF